MLNLSTTPNSAYLLHLARHLLQFDNNEETSSMLAEMAGTDESAWIPRFYIANTLLRSGELKKAERIIADVDAEQCLSITKKPAEIKIVLDTLVLLGQTEKAAFLLESAHVASYITSRFYIDLTLKIGNALMRLSEIEKARRLLLGIDVKKAYAESKGLKDVYARIGWTIFSPRREYDQVVEWMHRDVGDGRLSPAWRLNQAKAIAKTKGMEAAMPLIEKAYLENPNLKNAHAQVAWICYIPEDFAYKKTIPYFRLDQQRECLSGEWLINFADALMAIGDEEAAERQIEIVYRKNPRARNGFARCGLSRFFTLHYAPEKALEWFERDRKQGRLDNIFLIHYATLIAAVGDINTAEDLIEDTYTKYPQLKNGYALIGWYYYILKKHDPEKALMLFERDQKSERLSRYWGFYAALFAYLGKRTQAEKIASSIYALNRRNVHCLVGICDYAFNRDLNYLYKMFEQKEVDERNSQVFLRYLLAAIVLKQGNKIRSELLLKNLANSSSQAPLLATSYLKRVSTDWNGFHDEFLTKELEGVFYKESSET